MKSTLIFNVFLDPKCDWALQNLGEFPVEINRAPYETLLRVPGIGVKSAMRIVATRKQVALRFEDLKKMGVVLKRAVYFITCSGRMMYPVQIHEDAIAAQLISEEKRKQWQLSQSGCTARCRCLMIFIWRRHEADGGEKNGCICMRRQSRRYIHRSI